MSLCGRFRIGGLDVGYRAAIPVGNLQSWIGCVPSAPRVAGEKRCVVLLAGMTFSEYIVVWWKADKLVSQEFQVVGYEGGAMLEVMLFPTGQRQK